MDSFSDIREDGIDLESPHIDLDYARMHMKPRRARFIFSYNSRTP